MGKRNKTSYLQAKEAHLSLLFWILCPAVSRQVVWKGYLTPKSTDQSQTQPMASPFVFDTLGLKVRGEGEGWGYGR
jgi:hypothetical protein